MSSLSMCAGAGYRGESTEMRRAGPQRGARLLLLAGLFSLPVACSDSPSGPDPGLRPNFILILTDDMTVHETAFLPSVETLAQRGLTFSNAFVTTPQCGPSRASLLRGQYAHNHDALDNHPPFGGFTVFRALRREQSTIATWLHEAGYATGYVGKYLNHYGDDTHSDWTHVPPGWEEWYAVLTGAARQGPAYIGYRLNENGVLIDYAGFEEYATDVYTTKALDFVRRRAADSTSFFLLIAPIAPHGPATPAPRHAGRFAGVTAPRSPSFNEADISDKSVFTQRPLLSNADIAAIDDLYQRRLESLLAVDDMVDSLVNVLEELGIMGNTYLLFTSDNGFHLGEHRSKPGKNSPYEEDLRVPLIIVGPRAGHGQIRDELVLNIDLAPTLADLAGVPAPSFVDGRSIRPLLSRGLFTASPKWRHRFLAENWNGRFAPQETFDVVRTETHSFIWRPSGHNEFYDLRQDPYQLDNLFGAADSAIVIDLTRRVDELATCSGVGCRMAEDAP